LCDGSDSVIVAELKCTIPLLSLQSYPFSLKLGDSVFATVTASNTYGESQASPAGNGATIMVVPDSPVSVTDNVEVTSVTRISLTWINGISHGGSPILDYKVTYD